MKLHSKMIFCQKCELIFITQALIDFLCNIFFYYTMVYPKETELMLWWAEFLQ